MADAPRLTTTSYTLLGLLAIKPWTTYELAQQMERSVRMVWPRARSKVYEEPKKLVAHGLARASRQSVGRRARTLYTITPKGRRALARWLDEPGEAPQLEWEQLVKVFFSESGSKQGLLTQLDEARAWARSIAATSVERGSEFLETGGPFPDRAPQNVLWARFISEYAATVGEWATWAAGVVESWPDDPAAAPADWDEMRRIVERDRGRAEGAARPSSVDR